MQEKGTTGDEVVGWHHQLDGHEFKQALEVGDGQGSLACCSPWGRKVRQDWATELNWGVEGDDRGQDGWMASLTQWTWVWVNSGRRWKTGKLGMPQSMCSQRVRHDWAAEQQQREMWVQVGLCKFVFMAKDSGAYLHVMEWSMESL